MPIRLRIQSFLTHVPKAEGRAVLLSLVVSVVLVAVKFVAYFVTGSAAIFSDALENVVNVIAAH
jgi:divalent metal cation (Fe/Co/Zn/Cd) transporter